MKNVFQKSRNRNSLFVCLLLACSLSYLANAYRMTRPHSHTRGGDGRSSATCTRASSSYLDELGGNIFRAADKRCLVGLTTDGWNIGLKKYKDFLAVHKMAKRLEKSSVANVDVHMWEINQGPHYDELSSLLQSYWLPDFTANSSMLLKYDLIIVPDPVLAKYLVEAFYVKEDTLQKKREYYTKMLKSPWGVPEAWPPKERYAYEQVRDLPKQKWIRKFPPLATCGEEAHTRLKNHAQIEYFSYGVEDFALHLPQKLLPSNRVLLLRYKNRFESLVASLVLRGINVTSAYPVTWMRREWSAQEERMAKEVDVVYLHDAHCVAEWRERLGVREKEAVAACHDEEVARVAKSAGFKDIFFAKKSDTDGLYKTVMQAVDYAKSPEYGTRAGKR